jgi:uncharacterized protein YggU (UPF0235/DUF167 family)
MRLKVRVHPGSRALKSKERDGDLHVWVRAPPVDGKANAMVLGVLASIYGIPKSAIRLAAGGNSRTKIFEIQGR